MPDLFTQAQATREAEAATVPARPSTADRIAQAFREFHAQHPGVYQRFCEQVQALRDAGHDHYSADGILHVIRFETSLNIHRDGGFKINNNYSALYARKWQADHPAAADFFSTRVRKSKTA